MSPVRRFTRVHGRSCLAVSLALSLGSGLSTLAGCAAKHLAERPLPDKALPDKGPPDKALPDNRPALSPQASATSTGLPASSADVVFSPPASINYRFDRQYKLPGAHLSNPSGLTFGGHLPDGRVLLWAVCDGSSLFKDHFDPARTVVKLLIDPSGKLPPEVEPITLDARITLCDLESIDVDPADGGLLVADERVAGEPRCGGTGPNGEAHSRVFKVAPDGRWLGGPWEVDIINNDNNGAEGIAARARPDGTHVYVFEERKAGQSPVTVEYRLVPGAEPKLELVRRFKLAREIGSVQSGADFRKSDGRLLVVDRDRAQLVEVDLDAAGEPGQSLKTASFRALTIDQLGLQTSDPGLHQYGLVEGVATDDTGALYLILDNNSEPYQDGDPSPRLLRLVSMPR